MEVSGISSEEEPPQVSARKRRGHRRIQVNFRASSKWLQIVRMLAKLEGRTSSSLMRELLTLGIAQYVNIYYRTPQLIRRQQLEGILQSQTSAAAAKGKTARKNDV